MTGRTGVIQGDIARPAMDAIINTAEHDADALPARRYQTSFLLAVHHEINTIAP